MHSCKGGIVPNQLGKIILYLIGFVILILVFQTLFNKEEINREVCYNSVILRGTLPDAFNVKDMANLKCQTTKYCITDKTFGKGDCSEFDNERDKKDYETIRVSSKQTQEEINRFVARELASCWSMMGQGKVQIFTRDIKTKKSCSVCSRIAFDKGLKDKFSATGVEGIGDYLVTREVPGQDMSYWKYLTGKEKIDEYDEKFNRISIDEKAIVFMETTKSDWKDWAVSLPAGVVGIIPGVVAGMVIGGGAGFIVAGPFGIAPGIAAGKYIGGAIGFVGVGTAGFVYESGKKKEEDYSTGWLFRDYNFEELKKFECDSFENIG